ncbi:MAG: hypothetical protein AB7N24_13515 [Dehalococcoidia bacterium]
MAELVQCEHGITEIKLSDNLRAKALEWLKLESRDARSELEQRLLDWVREQGSTPSQEEKDDITAISAARQLQHELRFYLLMVGNESSYPDPQLAPWEAAFRSKVEDYTLRAMKIASGERPDDKLMW